MKAIQGLLVILFVFFLSNTAFAKADSVESGIASDSAGLQTGSGELVNYSKGSSSRGSNSGTSGSGVSGGSGEHGGGKGESQGSGVSGGSSGKGSDHD
ncbi:MAG: hypothetical protein ACE5GQ_04180 [Nitrospinales bacterium]